MPVIKALIDKEELCKLIPHAGSMCLLDAVVAWDEQEIECVSSSHLQSDNPLRNQGRLASVHALEYGAQAMAVHGGLLARAAGETVSSGYLAALRDARLFINRLDDLSGPLIVRATQLMAGQGNMIYQIHIEHAGQVVASARATVVTGGKSIA